MNSIYIVVNKWQGIHFIASTKEKAEEYIESKLDYSYGSCWNKDSWSIIKQPLNDYYIGL
jgi:hypothetical protein